MMCLLALAGVMARLYERRKFGVAAPGDDDPAHGGVAAGVAYGTRRRRPESAVGESGSVGRIFGQGRCQRFVPAFGRSRRVGGRFEGRSRRGAVPQYVYYPYSADAGTSTATLAVTVDAEQTQTGTTASIGANDFKIGSYDAAQKRFSLRNKLSLLAFTVDDLTGSELSASRSTGSFLRWTTAIVG